MNKEDFLKTILSDKQFNDFTKLPKNTKPTADINLLLNKVISDYLDQYLQISINVNVTYNNDYVTLTPLYSDEIILMIPYHTLNKVTQEIRLKENRDKNIKILIDDTRIKLKNKTAKFDNEIKMKIVIDKQMVNNMIADGEEPQEYIKPLFKYILNNNIVFYQVIADKKKSIKVTHNDKCIYKDVRSELTPQRIVVLDATNGIKLYFSQQRDNKIKQILK